MPVLERSILTWTVENNDQDKWAVFARVSGKHTQMTPWASSADAAVKLLSAITAVEPQPTRNEPPAVAGSTM